MQIGAINSVNFKGRERNYNPEADYVTVAEDYDSHPKTAQDAYNQAKEEAENDVSPLTCILGALTGYLAIRKGSKIVGVTRGFVAKAANSISQFFVGATGKIIKNMDTEKISNRVSNFFGKFTNDKALNVNSDKLTTKFNGFVSSVFGPKTAKNVDRSEAILEKLNNNDIYLNARSLFDNAVAGIAAYFVADGVSDVTEERIDKKNVNKKVGDFLAHAAKEAEPLADVLLS